MNSSSLISLLFRLWRHISSRRRMQLGFLFLLMIVSTISEVVSIGAVLPFLGALTSPETFFTNQFLQPLIEILGIQVPSELAFPLTVIFACTALVSGILRLIFIWFQTRLSHAIGADLSIEIYRRTLYQPYSVHVSRNSSEIIAGILSKANGVVNGIVLPTLIIFSSFFMLAAILTTLTFIQPVIAAVSISSLGASYLLVTIMVKKRLEQNSKYINEESNNVVKGLQEGLGGIRDVLINGTQAEYCRVYQTADQKMRRALAHVQIISSCPRYVIEAFGMIIISCIAYAFIKQSNDIGTIIPVLGALAIGAQRLLPVSQQIYSSLAFLKAGRSPLIDVINLLEQPDINYPKEISTKKIEFKKSIELSDVKFRYRPSSPWILQGIDLKIPKGSCVGIVGVTGSGKSSLIDVIMGLLHPEQGNFMVDGIDITRENYRSWQDQIAHVPQSIFLSDATIYENIAFGIKRDQIDLQRVYDAAKKAQLSETIEAMEHKYETFVGERGIRLSGGQRQRIGIARALYKQAKILVFDEATSALDNDTENAVMSAIDKLGDELTILMVAHRVTTLRNCDIIVELVDGMIARSGNYSDLIEE